MTTVFPYPNTEILLILELRIILWVVYNQLYDGRFLFAGYCTDDDDDDGNENGNKAIGLGKQNNNFARASRFFVHFSAVVARLQRETA